MSYVKRGPPTFNEGWQYVETTDPVMVPNMSYYVVANADRFVTLPATSILGDFFKIIIRNAAGGITFNVKQNAGQNIFEGASFTTTGTAGMLRFVNPPYFTVVLIRCVISNSIFVVEYETPAGSATFI